MKRENGFTLIEVLIAVVIIAVVAAIAVPSYRQHVLRSKIPEATSKLAELRMKMEQWYADKRSYENGPCPAAGAPITVPGARYFTYSCTEVGPAIYTLQASGVASEGMTGFTYILTHTNARKSRTPSWGDSENCWISKQGESC